MAEKESKGGGLFNTIYGKNYKFLLIIPAIVLIFSLIYMTSFYSENNDIMRKDVTLTGGTTFTVFTEEEIDVGDIESALTFDDVLVRILTDLRTGKQIAFSIETQAKVNELKAEVEDYLGRKLDEKDYTAEFTGAALSESFYKELIRALIIAFVLMAIVVFILFRVPIPSLAVILAAIMDIIITLTMVNVLGLRLSIAGIAAFLMLIGYTVDTNIMLTTRLLKRRENVLLERMKGALKTGVTMTLTSFIVVFASYFIIITPVLKQVFLILSVGLLVDLMATWLGNAPILKWYCDKIHIT